MSDIRRLLTLRWVLVTTFFLAMVAGWLGIVVMSLSYFLGVPHPFVVEKLPLRHEAAFLVVLKTHVAAAIFSLPACLVLLSARFRARFLRAHRWLGRATGVIVLLALVPSGFVLALTARGGMAGTLGFALSGVIVVVAMVRAVARARAGDVGAHRRAARHVVAQLSVAVTSRAMLAGFGSLGLHGDDAYLVALWIPVLGSAAIVEGMEPRSFWRDIPRRTLQAGFAGMSAGLLLAAIAATLRPARTLAAETLTTVAEAQVQRGLVAPLTRWYERRAKFSRAMMPSEVSARLLEAAPQRDASGATFVRFVLEERFMNSRSTKGCVYPETGEIYVMLDRAGQSGYQQSSSLFGDARPAPARACVAE